uniref:Putative conserved secreted protein n=1 Tax=Ixodes ricinus TaxID=34613 RepID=A0A6B0V0S9_IXORI
MFKLSFFLVFVFAGLCFGETSEGEVSSGGSSGSGPEEQNVETKSPEEGAGEGLAPLKVEGATSPSGAGASDSEKKDENTDVSETNGEKEAEGSGSKGEEGAGYELPDYIGSLEDKRKYVIKLLSNCGQSQEYSVNEKNIFFHNCTYICVKRDANLTPEVRRIPRGMTCNQDKGECPSEGSCPLPMC